MSLDDLERELYQKQLKNTQKEKKEIISPKEKSVLETAPRDWGVVDNAEKQSHFHISKNYLITGIGVLVVATISAAGLLFFNFLQRNDKNVTIAISAPAEVVRGVPFEIKVNATNQLDISLTNVVFDLRLPQGIIPFSQNNSNMGKAIMTERDGEVGGGDLAKKTFTVVPIGDIGSIQKITAGLSYSNGKGNEFRNQETRDVLINDSALSLDVRGPDNALGGSAIDFDVIYKNNSSFDFSELAIQAQYPPSFKFISSDIQPSSLNNYWKIPSGLKGGAEGKITIHGVYDGSSDSQLVFPVTISSNFIGTEYNLVTKNLSIATAPSPVSLTITANNKDNYIARVGDTIRYIIRYQNLSGVALSDVVIKATLLGNLFDISTVNTNGNLNSISNSVIWNASQISSLKLLDPGASGQVGIDIKLKSTFPTDRYSEKNFYVQLKAQFDSPSVPYYLSAKNTSISTSLETRIGGAIFLDARAFYRDSSSGITNSGQFPPKANTATQYTIYWRVKNFATDARDVSISASLQSGVIWTGVVGGNTNAPVYNERTGEITWNIDKVSAMKGIFTDPIEIVFQVEATPNITQIGNYMPLLSETIIKGTDDFTGLELAARDNPLTTELPDDTTVASGKGVVVP